MAAGRKAPVRSLLIGVILLGVLVAAFNHRSTNKAAATTVAQTSGPFQANDQTVADLFSQKLGSNAGKLPRVRSASCVSGSCTVDYNADTYVVSIDETITALNPIWAQLFSDSSFLSATITAWGELTSVGGKKSQGALFHLTCNRQAANQIDWTNVDAKGIKALCTWVPLVNFK